MTYEEAIATFKYGENGVLLRSDGTLWPTHGIGRDMRYRALCYKGRKYYVHRLVWLLHHGYTPSMVDHINGDFADNRIENLRECTNAQNQYNGPRKSHNKSGYKGVAFCKGYRKPWRARIIVDKKVVELGYYNTPEEAAKAYAEGAARHAREFARVD